MRGHVRYDIAMKLKRQSDYTHLETLLVRAAQTQPFETFTDPTLKPY
jgi:hypothetical protein